MGDKFEIISKVAALAVSDEVNRLPLPGGLVGYFDLHTGSVIIVAVDKRSGQPIISGWSVHGPYSEEKAKEFLSTEVGKIWEDGWARQLH